MKVFTKTWFKNRLAVIVRSAGPRYSPQVHVSLPINRIFHWLGRTDEFYKEFTELRESFHKEWEDSSLRRNFSQLNLSIKLMGQLDKKIISLMAFLDKFKKSTFDTINFDFPLKMVKKVDKDMASVEKFLRENAEQLEADEAGSHKGTEPHSPKVKDLLSHCLYEVRKIEEILYKLRNVCNSDFAHATNTKSLLLLGEAGIGKTHLLCDVVGDQLKSNIPAILVLGQQLQTITDPLKVIIAELGLSFSKEQFLQRLNGIAKKRNRRVLILIDAINEGDRKGWKRGLKYFLKEIEKYPGLAVAMSCRTPFDKVTIPARSKIVKSYHQGFARHELEALKVFTTFYKIPLPEIPILTPEFTNPLFLKLFCESLEDVVINKKHKQIQAISSGQKGMTNILEDIVIKKGRRIAKDFDLTPKLVWRIIKEDFAASFARDKKSWIMRQEALVIIKKHIADAKQAKKFLLALIYEGLLSEDIVFDVTTKAPMEVVRFTYQKFSDHIIARHLLGKYFDKENPKASFSSFDQLGWLFKDSNTIYSNAGLIEALIVEFPTRIGNKGEMFDYLPVKINGELAELFISGLYWRDSKGFNKSTDRWVGAVLNPKGQFREKTLDVLVALATKPNHPYNAMRLDKYLRRFSIYERDLLWSEYLRGQENTSTIYKIIDWIEKFQTGISEEYAQEYTIILRWFLTSTVRPLRDRATRALYYLGKKYPRVLFQATEDSLQINDPYVPERTFAASYGVVMALHYQNKDNFNKRVLAPFAKRIFMLIFSPKAPHGTTHILMRDYARHIISIALLHLPKILNATDKGSIKPPFKRGGIRKWGETEDKDKANYRNGSAPMCMDFENYTLGRLVRDRNNYDFKNNEYQKVKANIFWRIYQLGYSHSTFKDIDSQIGRYNWNRSEHIKTERYGKKYCWIAFYELSGFREDEGLLPEKYGHRISDTDIDPSFPNEILNEMIIKKDFLGKDDKVISEWIQNGPVPDVEAYLELNRLSGYKGPWVLLDGYVNQENLGNNRNVFIFIRGLFSAKEESAKLVEALKTLTSPGNNRLPDAESDYYTFAGEIPWCETYSYQQYKSEIEIPTGNKKIIHEEIKQPEKILVIKIGEKEIKIPNYSESDLKKGFIEREQAESLLFKVDVPVRNFSWESGRSIVNPGPHAPIPTKELCESLGLTSRPQTFDMYDSKGKIASLARSFDDTSNNRHKMVYLRKDLLNRYLHDNGLDLIWVIWGERCFRSKEHQDLEKFAKTNAHYRTYKYVVSYKR